MFFFDYNYLLFIAPALILAIWAQIRVTRAISKYSKIPSFSGLTGAQVARALLDANDVRGVKIEVARGFLSDHYDPSTRTLRLSEQVYYGTSVASAGIAAHEVGHAIQHKMAYSPLIFRQILAPVTMIGTNLAWIFIMVGLFVSSLHSLSWIGIGLYSFAVLFSLVTLPVEFNASTLAKASLVQLGMVSNDEREGVSKVLSAAAMTYVAAALTAVLELLYFVLRVLGSSRD